MRLTLFILAAFATLGLVAGFLVAAVVSPTPSEPQDAPVSQEDYGRFFPEPQDIKRIHPTPEPTPEPTLPPTPAPTPAPVPEREALAALVHQTFPDDPRMGGPVVWNESLKFPDGEWQGYVYGGVWSATGDCGLMQINWYYHGDKFAAHGWTSNDCFIPERNLTVAQEIYEDAGCGAWTTC